MTVSCHPEERRVCRTAPLLPLGGDATHRNLLGREPFCNIGMPSNDRFFVPQNDVWESRCP